MNNSYGGVKSCQGHGNHRQLKRRCLLYSHFLLNDLNFCNQEVKYFKTHRSSLHMDSLEVSEEVIEQIDDMI